MVPILKKRGVLRIERALTIISNLNLLVQIASFVERSRKYCWIIGEVTGSELVGRFCDEERRLARIINDLCREGLMEESNGVLRIA
jgi:hypothetical protein